MKFGDISDVKTVHDGKVVKHVRSYTTKIKIDNTDQLRKEMGQLISDISTGKCLDFWIEVRVGEDKKPKWLIKTTTDPCSKIRM